MSTADPKTQEQRAREFMTLLPLTLAVSGLPDAAHGQHLNEGQMEARATSIRLAYKVARQIIQEIVR